MFLLRSIASWFGVTNSEQRRIEELQRIFNEIEVTIENNKVDKESNKYNEDFQSDETKEGYKCFQKVGVITNIITNHGVIDNTLLFNMNKVSKHLEDLKIGYKVEYLCYKPDNDPTAGFRIIKIIDIVDYSWDTTTEEEMQKAVEELRAKNPKCFSKHERNIVGTVTQRREHFIVVDNDTEDIEVDLDVAEVNFVPETGDRVVLTCMVKSDNSYVDCKGDILECKRVSFLRKKEFKGVITKIENDWGIIEKEAFFLFDTLDAGYQPCYGDLVSAELIENESMNQLDFRALKVALIERKALQKELDNKNKELSELENELYQNKNGITVTDNIHFRFDKLNVVGTKNIVVTNESEYPQEIIRYVFKTKISDSQLRLRNADEARANFKLSPGASVVFKLNAKSKRFGLSAEIFEIQFSNFSIARSIKIEVGDSFDNQQNGTINRENTRFGRNNYKERANAVESKWSSMHKANLIPGVSNIVRPRFVKQRIHAFDIPERLKSAVLSSDSFESLTSNIEKLYSVCREELKPANYSQRFSVLLFLEEIERFMQMRNYDRDRAHFNREGEYLSLVIENLAETRPSLMIGDTIHASNPWSDNENEQSFQGYIHKVYHNKVMLKFNDAFHTKYNGEDYRLEFFFSRSSFRKMHHAVNDLQKNLGNEYLFPTKVIYKNNVQWNVDLNDADELVDQVTKKVKPWFNKNLNQVQKIAIKNVLRGEARPMPYVIFGPPGTGKTVTVIEAILHLVKNCSSRILIGTPTNSAADLIATRLIQSDVLIPGDFIRLIGQNLIERDLVPEHLKPYCATVDIAIEGTIKDPMITTDSGLKLKCQSKYLGAHRIIIGTCITLGTLINLGYKRDHFSHVIIDEAGQCTEPEIMTVIKQVDGKNGQIILAGDPRQLGPIVLHPYSCQNGLQISFLVRLLNTPPYSRDKIRYQSTGYNPLLVTKLINCYRSIPSILNVFSNLFYDSELVPMITGNSREYEILDSLKPIFNKYVPKKVQDHGLLFWGVRGQNRQDNDSPSWYNGEEASQLYIFTLKLLKEGIKANQIGIITPYQKQVKKIRQLFQTSDLIQLPKIGTVEDFQGQERDIILISTVRSAKNLINVDLKYTLGFIQNPKRMNVAISRSRALMVIFGNPHLLALDPNWEKMISYCISKNAYTGCDLPLNLLSQMEE